MDNWIYIILFVGGLAIVLLVTNLIIRYRLKKCQGVERDKARSNLDELLKLAPLYDVEKRYAAFDRAIILALSMKSIHESTEKLESISEEISTMVSSPHIYFDKKIYDPLDREPIRDQVDLEIDHPKYGRRVIAVSRKNGEKYLKEGPRAFPKKRPDDTLSRTYIVCDDEIGYFHVDSDKFREKFRDGDSCLMDKKFEGGGGDFGGAGGSGDWPAKTESAEPTEVADSTILAEPEEKDEPAGSETQEEVAETVEESSDNSGGSEPD
jgi:uncharacterized membrane protein YgcG